LLLRTGQTPVATNKRAEIKVRGILGDIGKDSKIEIYFAKNFVSRF